MIEKTIEKIAETEKKTEKDLEHLDKRWSLKLRAEKAINISRLKDYRKDIAKKMEIKKEEHIHIIDKEIMKMEKDTERHLRDMENACAQKKDDILEIIAKNLKS
ncbi:MAG: hypothetical protein KAI51_02650 [Candidatus Aenigmarchaeota archaeon]|nr:hypothetical protein [Candidatus Aenigmarchaeota archaeon]MCK5452312.1 hypothetical protein [Candidatus Aenigmarchaeota archaeon]